MIFEGTIRDISAAFARGPPSPPVRAIAFRPFCFACFIPATTFFAFPLVDIPIVLHGGSGTPEEDIRKAIGLGIAKVNVASDLVHTVRKSLMRQWNEERNFYTPFALAESIREMKEMVTKWIRITGSQGRA